MHIELKACNDFVRNHHRHHDKIQGHRFSIGAVVDRRLVGVIIVGRPVGGQHQDDWVEVTRCCTDGTYNACSFLYGAAARAAKELGFFRIQTYILEQELGSSLLAAGWQYERLSHPIGWHHDGPRPARTVREGLDKRKKLWFRILQSEVSFDLPAASKPLRYGFFDETQ